ncbi:MAG: putative toxin-antitoxin system toxin component, PIN family [bacterium]
MSEEEIADLLQALAQGSAIVSGRAKVKASRDPEDDKFLTAAIEAEAQCVVTGDRDLLDLKSYRGVRIVRPAARFLSITQRTGGRKS